MGNSVSSGREQVARGWDATQIPSQRGKVAIVTGANSGIGFETALELARKGADVVLACRNEQRGRQAEDDIQELLASTDGAGRVEFTQLDLGSLGSVQAFVVAFRASHDRLDLLINNAGVMAGPFARTVDGFESQFATNHLGHFVLTAKLFDMLQRTPGEARVVNVSSMLHCYAWRFNEDDIMWGEYQYSNYLVYSDSKLCNLLFTHELDRRLRSHKVSGVAVVACHPGSSATNLVANSEAMNARSGQKLWAWLFNALNCGPFFQSQQMGALPTLYAATGPTVSSGDFYGPGGFMAAWGHPTLQAPSAFSSSETAAAKLWAFSEQLAGVEFNV